MVKILQKLYWISIHFIIRYEESLCSSVNFPAPFCAHTPDAKWHGSAYAASGHFRPFTQLRRRCSASTTPVTSPACNHPF